MTTLRITLPSSSTIQITSRFLWMMSRQKWKLLRKTTWMIWNTQALHLVKTSKSKSFSSTARAHRTQTSSFEPVVYMWCWAFPARTRNWIKLRTIIVCWLGRINNKTNWIIFRSIQWISAVFQSLLSVFMTNLIVCQSLIGLLTVLGEKEALWARNSSTNLA